MKILQCEGTQALCSYQSEQRWVDMRLVDGYALGAFVLVHLERAIRLIEADEAAVIGDALKALDLALRGENVDHLFADLVESGPRLPDHLRSGEEA